MQQPQQQFVPVYVPYFNQPRVAAPQQEYSAQQPAPLVYSEQVPQQQSVYPQVPLVEQQQPTAAVEQAPAAQQQQSCPFSRAACGRGRCCKRIDARKAVAVFALAPIFLYAFVYIASLFNYSIRYNAGSSFLFLIMSVVGAIMAIAGSKKSNIAVLGIFIGMTGFSTVLGCFTFIVSLAEMFRSFLSFLHFGAEFLIGCSKIAGIIAAAKLIKKIKTETSLPQFIEQQAEQQQQEQAQPQQFEAPAPVVIAPPAPVHQQVVPQPQVVAAPMYPQLQQFQAPIIAAPVVQQQAAPQQYATELQLLKDMGFGDAEKNTRLLQKHNGSLQGVVMEYVQA